MDDIVKGSEFLGKSLLARDFSVEKPKTTIEELSREHYARLLLGTLLSLNETTLSRIVPDSKSFLAPENEIGNPILGLKNGEVKQIVINDSEYVSLTEEEKIKIAHDKAVEYYRLFIMNYPGLSEEIKRKLLADEIPEEIDLQDMEVLFNEWTEYSRKCMTEEEIKLALKYK